MERRHSHSKCSSKEEIQSPQKIDALGDYKMVPHKLFRFSMTTFTTAKQNTWRGKNDTVFLMTEYRTLYFGSRFPTQPDILLHLHTNELTHENHIFGANSGRLKRFIWVWVAQLGLDKVPREAFAW